MVLRGPEERWALVLMAPRYEVSTLGRARMLGSARLLKPNPVKGGKGRLPYLRITVTNVDGLRQAIYLHSAVLAAFCGPRPEGFLALHKDGIITNCALDNLYWGTYQDNANDRVSHGRSGVGVENPNVKLEPADVLRVRRLYGTGMFRQVDLADQFGTTQAHISRIVRGASWRHL